MPRLALNRGSVEMACAGGGCSRIPRLNGFGLWLASVVSVRLWKETVMDTTVSGIGAVVVAELRAAGYMESTVGQYAKTIKALTEFASGREYSTGLGAEFAAKTTSARTGRFSPARRFDYRRLVTVFDSYVQTGRVDLAVRGRGGGGPRPEGSDFVALDAAWGPRWAGAVWHRPPARPMGGWRAATWCSWKDTGSQCWTRRMAPVSWRSWNPYWDGGPSRRCFGWCRTFARSSSSPAAPICSMR